ncbi:MAG: hypothetical protein ACO1QB_08285 [Verrucomicrobiales bacterium]
MPVITQSEVTKETAVRAGASYILMWDYEPSTFAPETRFRIYTNGVFAYEVNTNSYSVSVNSGTNTYSTALTAGTVQKVESITIASVNLLDVESEQSGPLTIFTLGKPLRPVNLRKK